MLLTWLISGCPKHASTQVAVVYISGVAASFLKTPLCRRMPHHQTGSLPLAHHRASSQAQGQTPPDLYLCKRILSALAIVGAFIAILDLTLLSGFNTEWYLTEHLIFLLVFTIGVSLRHLHRDRDSLSRGGLRGDRKACCQGGDWVDVGGVGGDDVSCAECGRGDRVADCVWTYVLFVGFCI